MRHAVIKALFLAMPDALALRQPQDQRMGNAFLVLQRFFQDRRHIRDLFNHPAIIEYVTNDQYGQKYHGEYAALLEEMVDNNLAWKQVKKAVWMLEPLYMLLRRCDVSTPNFAWVAISFHRALEQLRALPTLVEVGAGLDDCFSDDEKASIITIAEERYHYTITECHQGAALLNPHYFLKPGEAVVPDSWTGCLRVLLEHLYPGPANQQRRLFISENLPRMWRHETPFDNADCWAAAAKKDLDIAAWYQLYCHMPSTRTSVVDLTPLREAGMVVGSGQCGAGQTERINKVVSRVHTKIRTSLTIKNGEMLSRLCHYFQQKNARALRLAAAEKDCAVDKAKLRENLHLSTLWSVHAESVKEQRRQQREAMAELVRERASDPEWMPPEGGMLDLLFSGDPEAAAVIDHGDGGIARLLQAALARAQAAREAAGETAAAPTAQGADAPTATTTTTAAELAERPAAAGPPPPTEDLQALRLLQLRHTDQAWQRGRATDELEI